MPLNEATLYAFLLVFVRCSAMLLASPVFGAQNTPLQVRILTTLCIAGALTAVLRPKIGPVPPDMGALLLAVAHEAAAGLLIGGVMSLVLQAANIAGSILDLQVGLSMSQALNPLLGVQVTVIAQFKFMLGTVLYLSMDGHHQMLQAFAASYSQMPALGVETMPMLGQTLLGLVSGVFILGLQISLPVLAVSMVVDAALGLISKAVPQMQVLVVGAPGKIILGLVTLSLCLPALATGVNSGIGYGVEALGRIFNMR